MQSREQKCFSKIINVCKNRGFGDLGNDILRTFGPKYLKKEEIKDFFHEAPKTIKYADKITFLEAINFGKNCSKCQEMVEEGSAAFIHGKALYHVLCGIDVLEDGAKDNFYYKRWSAKTTAAADSNHEEEI
jgi:hypothetical protein